MSFLLGQRLFKVMNFECFFRLALAAWALLAINYVAAEGYSPAVTSYGESTQKRVAAPAEQRSTPVQDAARRPSNNIASAAAEESKQVNDWLMRIQDASRKLSFVGTFVVQSDGKLSSAKIWRVCEGGQQLERVETLTGAPRSIFRHNDQVVTFLPDHKVVRREKRDSLSAFPELLQSSDSHIADFYTVRKEGNDRVAGVEADITVLVPKDRLRFGYRVWTEQKMGLVIKLQTLDTDDRVLEQAAFSELQLNAPLKMNKLVQMMTKVDGYRLENSSLVKTTASAEGWLLKAPVAGFNSISCYLRPAPGTNAATGEEPFQWIFSDGLASVSIFIEPFDRSPRDKESSLSLGATQTMTKQVEGHWVTVMGEVPLRTLRLFADALTRKK
jgi:sigma-E factor negative regulatory protein RseB